MAAPSGNSAPPSPQQSGLFGQRTPGEGSPFEAPQDRRFPTTALGVAFVAVVVLVAAFALLTRKHTAAPAPNTLQPVAAYAPSLVLSGLAMSESTSISGGKSTFLDGRIANHGSRTVTAITVQAVFANDTSLPPQLQTEPLALIRTREPYVDTQPVSAAPLAPGAEADFRLIFENLNANWNGQQPGIRVIRVLTR